MTVDIATLGIRIDSTEARQAVRDLENFQGAGARAERSISGLETAARKAEAALAFLGIGAGVAAIIKYADEYTKFTAQLKLATQSQREYVAAVEDVRKIATASQQDLSATGMLYARIANGTRELGISQKNVAAITETVNLALKVSGATSAEAASAMLQLSQSFASGTLRGEEFNAVNEAAPRLMKALADGIGVPVGALKDMASNGEITSRVMATVLPQALQQLQEESKNVQTISGAFTVLKNNVMEFTGTQAQANGTVSILTGGIMLLANNLNVLMGVVGTITAMNVANWMTSWVAKTYERVTAAQAEIAAAQASRTANIAAAEADLARAAATGAQATATQAAILISREEAVVRLAQARNNIAAASAAIQAASAAGAQSFALRVLRDSTVELAAAEQARAAAIAELAILGQQQARISAQITAAAAAQTAAQSALATATTAAAGAAGIASRAISFLGGPVGIAIGVLGLAATAWSWYSAKSTEANSKTADKTEQSTEEVVAQMTKQIEVMERRNKMALAGMPSTKKNTALDDQLEKINADLEMASNAQGKYANLTLEARTDILKKLGAQYGEVTRLIERYNQASADGAGNSAAAKALIEVRERLTGVNGQYLKDLKALQTAREEGAVSDKEYIALTSMLATETWKSSDAGKAATEAAKKASEAYKSLITSIHEATATNKLELAAGIDATESQKSRIKLDQELASGKVKLSAAQLMVIRSALDEQAASERALKSQRDVASAIADLVELRRQNFAAAAAEANANEMAAQNFGKTKAEIEALTVARLEERLAQAKELELTKDEISETERLIAVKRKSAVALSKVDALGYTKQLSDENKRFAADSIIDEKARSAALTEIDAEIWRKRIALAGDGTDQQKALQEQYNVWYANQALKPMIDAQREAVRKYDDVFRQGFADMLNHGKSGWQSFTKSLTTTFKTSVADQLYKMFAQPLVVNLVGNMLGLTGAAGAAANGAAGAAGGALTGAALGTTLGAIGTGAFQTAGAVLTGQIGLFDTIGAGVSALSTGTLSGMTAGLSSLAGALGPIALGVAAIMTLAKHWDDSGTIHTGGAASASAAGVKNIDAGTLGFQRINTADGTNQLTSQLAASVVSILDSTATAFGKTAGYTAATAFADDTSKDGAWGALIISNMNGLVSQWGDANSRWAPKVFADGEAGQKEYLAMLSSSVRSALDGIGLPAWAKSMLDNLGNAPSLEELAKVVDTINATQSALTIMGQRLKGFAGLADDAVTELIKASGGVDKLATNASAFFDSYYSDSEKTAVITKQVADALKAVGLQMPATRAEYRAMIEQQLALGTSGAIAAAALLKNAEAYAKFVPAVEDSTTSLEKAKSDLAEAYSAESEAIKNTIKNTQDYVKSLIGLRDSLMISDLSPLTPVEQYAEAARQYEATRAAAMSGDATAQSGLQNAITAFLKASRTVNASSDQYKADYAKVQADLAIAIASGKSQVSTAEASLNALNKQVAGLTAVNESVLSVAAAIKQLTAIMGDGGRAIASTNATSSITSLYQSLLGRAPDAGGMQFWTTQMGNGLSISAIANAMMQSPEYLSLHGSHANGLRHVPFNRYRAELHEGEGVLTKSENQSYLALFGGSGGALMTEFRAMRNEIAELRKEQAQQTGALIASNFRANAEAAETVATATLDAAESSAWASKTAPQVI